MIPSSSNDNNETLPQLPTPSPATLDSRNRNALWVRIFTVSKGTGLAQGSPRKGTSARGFQTSGLAQRLWCQAERVHSQAARLFGAQSSNEKSYLNSVGNKSKALETEYIKRDI